NDWTELTPIGNPDALKWSSMIYDSVNQRCIMFGGENGEDHAVDYTWVYDGSLNTWSRRYPATAPAGRLNAGLAFDLNNNVIILFGGMVDFENHYDDTWIYSYESNVWTDMEEDSDSTTTNYFDFDPMLLALALPIGAAVIAGILIIRRKT
ncbi:MAG: kelch repeat-containing protein, partial [Candidatus Sifarchaeia archaeon]